MRSLILKCRGCGMVLPNTAFCRDASKPSGRQQPCKACFRKRRNEPGWRERAKQRRDLRRERNEALKLPPPSELVREEEPREAWFARRERVAAWEEAEYE